MAKMRVMIPCDEATRLLSEAQDRTLPTGERTVLRVHTWMCSKCRMFGEQLGFIRLAARGFAQRADDGRVDGADPADRAGDPSKRL